VGTGTCGLFPRGNGFSEERADLDAENRAAEKQPFLLLLENVFSF
jgi:hypothetical protein